MRCIGQARPSLLSPSIPVLRNDELHAGESEPLNSVVHRKVARKVRDANFAAASSGLDLGRRSPTPPRYPSLDYTDDCITQEEFLQTLNLVSKEKFEKTPIEQLKGEFPYRQISKVEPKPFSAPPEAKLYEGLPICCLLTEKWLKLEPVAAKFVRNSEQNLVNLSKAAIYCKTSLPQSEDNANVPKLRCREQKLYSLTYRVNKTWKYLDHVYCFNRSERMERDEILRTGLSRKGKILLKRCRPCNVVAAKMTKSEIERIIRMNKVPSQTVDVQAFYMRKSVGRPFKTPLSKHPGLVNIIKNPDKYIHLKTKFDGIINHSAVVDVGSKDKRQLGARYSTMRLNKKDRFRCKVLLSNVLWDLAQRVDACYVEETSIKVNDIHLLPLVLWQRSSRSLNVKTYDNRHSTASERNGPSCHPSLTAQKRLIQTPQPNLFANKDPHVNPHPSHREFKSPLLFSRLNRTLKTTFVKQRLPNGQKPPIACIDLTSDDDDDDSSTSNSDAVTVNGRLNGDVSKSSSSERNFANGAVKQEKSNESSGTWRDSKENGVASDSRPLRSATNTYSKGAVVNGSVKNGCWSGILLEKVHGKRKLSGSSANEDYNEDYNKYVNNLKVKKTNSSVSKTASPYYFHCHGCKYVMTFFEENDAYFKVHAHMAQFHSVTHPHTFLKITERTSDSSWLIEGFPGFKG